MQRNCYTKEISTKNHYGIIYFPEDIGTSAILQKKFSKIAQIQNIELLSFFHTFSKNNFMFWYLSEFSIYRTLRFNYDLNEDFFPNRKLNLQLELPNYIQKSKT